MTQESGSAMQHLLQFISQLDAAKISYSLNSVREAIMICISVPGERWEVEFFSDGNIEVERFISTGSITGEEELANLFQRFSDESP
jgi:hypothetical protein